MLNIDSRVRSVVGLMPLPSGEERTRRLNRPEMIRMIIELLLQWPGRRLLWDNLFQNGPVPDLQ